MITPDSQAQRACCQAEIPLIALCRFPGPALSMRSPKSVERDFIAYEKYNLFPQAKLYTQWPGSGTVGDPIFDQFMAETLPMIGDAKVREAVNRDATIALLDAFRSPNSRRPNLG
jgi:hypothetical protein